MKRFLIHVSTYWCGMDNTFRAEAESELELDEIADQLAYDNFQSYGCEADIAEEEGYDPDEMEDSDWDKLWETVDESQYYNFTIEEFEGDDEEWEEYGGEIYEDNIKGKYNVQFVLEDNYKCVKMWREQGLVCLQPNEGKF